MHNVHMHARATDLELLLLDIQLNGQKSRNSIPSKRRLLSKELRTQVN